MVDTTQLMSPEDLFKETRELVATQLSRCTVRHARTDTNIPVCQLQWSGIRGGDIRFVVSGMQCTLAGHGWIKVERVSITHQVGHVQQTLRFTFDRPYWSVKCTPEWTHLIFLVDGLKLKNAKTARSGS